MPTVAIIQARLGSSRLPGKVLEPFAGRSALAHVVARVRACPAIDEVVVATTTASRDDALVDVCAREGWRCTRGSEDDVLDRFYQTATSVGATTIVRITSDCPLLDPAIVAGVIARFRDTGADYATTSWPRATFPLGLSAEVISAEALATAWREDPNPAWREHVTPFLYRHPERFRIATYACDRELGHHRWTLDTPEDAALLRLIFDHLPAGSTDWRDVLALVEAHPAWSAINAAIAQKQVS